MASSRSIARPRERGKVFYPNLLKAPRRLQFLFALLGLLALGGLEIVLRPVAPISVVFGLVIVGITGFGLACLSLLYLPIATSLRISPQGITYTVSFWQRNFPWTHVRELRLISSDGPLFRDFCVEVVLTTGAMQRQRRRTIDANLFGWSAEALVDEMDEWRARHNVD
jgi:hypothetical protein